MSKKKLGEEEYKYQFSFNGNLFVSLQQALLSRFTCTMTSLSHKFVSSSDAIAYQRTGKQQGSQSSDLHTVKLTKSQHYPFTLRIIGS